MTEKTKRRRRVRLASNPLSLIGQQAGYYTSAERAAKLKCSRHHLLHIERGAAMPSPELVDRMAAAYQRTIEQIERAARLGRETLARRIIEQSRELG